MGAEGNQEGYFGNILVYIARLVGDAIGCGEVSAGDTIDAAWAIVALLNTTMEEQLNQARQVRVDRSGLLRLLALLFEGIRT